MTPTVMESGTIAEIDGWPGAMNMPRFRFCLDTHEDPTAFHIRKLGCSFESLPCDAQSYTAVNPT